MAATLRTFPLAAAALAALLAGCGGGDVVSETSSASAAASPEATAAEAAIAAPAFHRLPMALPEPDGSDADGTGASALQTPARFEIPASMQALDTRNLTDEAVQAWLAAPGRATALAAAPSSAVVYTPAQVRAAYGLPALPANTASLAPAAAAALGAGQTIYVVAAYHHPNLLADLAAFNARFGLPGCTALSLAAGSTTLPKPAAGCTVLQLHAGANASTTAKVPAYDAGWASEIALDTQWAHATAPLARIVVIEAADASSTTLQNAVALANRLGAGVVSMSFGAPEGSWVPSTATAFQGSGMSYVAATGDSGAAVAWPAVLPSVLSVGGTRLAYSAGSARSETAWSKAGGGISTRIALPNYQSTLTIPGEPAKKMRAVADVAFNADPTSGQYAAFTPSGLSQPGWYAFGGTSLGTPQWAGLVAVANAQRALAGSAPLGDFHALLYARLGPASASYAGAVYDITSGSNGSCAACTARAGYDAPTGLGTPRAAGMLAALVAK